MANRAIATTSSLAMLAGALVLLVQSSSVIAQTPPAGGANPVTASLRQNWDGAKLNIKESADLMPEANYSFKPVDSVRTFGQILAHLAGANFVFCSSAKGEKSPRAEDEFEKTATTRAQIIKAVADSHAYCDSVFASMDDKKIGEMIEMPFNMGKSARARALVMNIGHVNEHYGNLVTYFRLKNIVPPSSRR
jgi:DinB family protein